MENDVILIDANALIDFFLGEPEFQEASARLRRKHPDWMTLPLCRYEFGNVIRTYIRNGMLGESKGYKILQEGITMVRFCPECDDEAVLDEANRSRLTFYDASYVARARSLTMKLHTRDGEILRNCPDVAVPISDA
jgi:predicted nucleic acid-binding protein